MERVTFHVLGLPRCWDLRTPVVHRFMEREYVEEFFATGRLRLSSFAQFAKHADEERLDAAEGEALLVGIGEKYIVAASTKNGTRSYVLSTSTRCDAGILKAFDRYSCIRISNTAGFAYAIAKCVPGFAGGAEGFCIYTDRRVIQKRITFNGGEDIYGADGAIDETKARALLGQVGGVPDFFLFKGNRYAPQCEYRFLWHSDRPVADYLTIECPEARLFCEPVHAAPSVAAPAR